MRGIANDVSAQNRTKASRKLQDASSSSGQKELLAVYDDYQELLNHNDLLCNQQPNPTPFTNQAILKHPAQRLFD